MGWISRDLDSSSQLRRHSQFTKELPSIGQVTHKLWASAFLLIAAIQKLFFLSSLVFWLFSGLAGEAVYPLCPVWLSTPFYALLE